VKNLFSPIWKASFGLVFFGTPHRGGNNGVLEEVVGRVAKFFAKDSTDNDLLTCLKPDSLFTEISGQRFSLQQDKYEVLTFFETKETSFFGVSKVLTLQAKHCRTALTNVY
jgi:hypothetical protein